jgi:hypothetical protein
MAVFDFEHCMTARNARIGKGRGPGSATGAQSGWRKLLDVSWSWLRRVSGRPPFLRMRLIET